MSELVLAIWTGLGGVLAGFILSIIGFYLLEESKLKSIIQENREFLDKTEDKCKEVNRDYQVKKVAKDLEFNPKGLHKKLWEKIR